MSDSTIKYNLDKSIEIKDKYDVGLDEIKDMLIDGKYIDILKHPTRENQKIFIININNYIWAVPFVIDENHIFLKTAYPSRKYKNIYWNSIKEEIYEENKGVKKN